MCENHILPETEKFLGWFKKEQKIGPVVIRVSFEALELQGAQERYLRRTANLRNLSEKKLIALGAKFLLLNGISISSEREIEELISYARKFNINEIAAIEAFFREQNRINPKPRRNKCVECETNEGPIAEIIVSNSV